jgi:RNA polymerase sigma-70 factor, ECF subfamily
MDDLTPPILEMLIVEAYATAYTAYGNLNLQLGDFSTHLYLIIERRMGTGPLSSAACEFASRLHLNDLYLALACSQGSDIAWRQFASAYDGYIHKISFSVCGSSEVAKDLADSVLGHVFLPDTTGRSCMASYEGLSPLSAWLAAIIRHRAFNERRLQAGDMESLDLLKDAPDESSIWRTEAGIRAGRYRRMINDSFGDALGLLSDRERRILCLRYQRQLQVSDIARQFGVTPHAITQQIDRSGQKLRRRVLYLLRTRHHLEPAAIQECVADLLNNPEHATSVLNLAAS